MASGGDFAYEDPDIDNQLDNDDDDDDDDDEQEVHRTQPFQPGASSTPYNGGEQVEMKTMQHEQSGLPDTSYQEETPLLGVQAEQQRSWEALTRIRPEASAIELETSYSNKGRLQVKMIGFGKKVYDLFTKERGTGKQRLNPKLPKEIIKALGPPTEEIIAEDRDTIQEMKQRKAEFENQLKKSENLFPQIDEKTKEIELIQREIEEIKSKIDAIHDKYGSDLEMEAELRRLEQQKKNYETDLRDKKKELATLQKEAKKLIKFDPLLSNSRLASQKQKEKRTPCKKVSTKQKRRKN